MRRVVGLLHRQAVKAKAEGLFFNVGGGDNVAILCFFFFFFSSASSPLNVVVGIDVGPV
jgi:hypothetical protein